MHTYVSRHMPTQLRTSDLLSVVCQCRNFIVLHTYALQQALHQVTQVSSSWHRPVFKETLCLSAPYIQYVTHKCFSPIFHSVAWFPFYKDCTFSPKKSVERGLPQKRFSTHTNCRPSIGGLKNQRLWSNMFSSFGYCTGIVNSSQ